MDRPDLPMTADPADEFASTEGLPLRDGGTGDGTRPLTAAASVDESAASLDASLSAIASARARSLSAEASAIGLANVAGDAEMTVSAIGLVTADGSCQVRQSFVQGAVAATDVRLDQAATAATVAKTVTFDRSASLVTVASDAEVKGGIVGVLLAGRANVSEDARVLLSGRALVVLALAILGGLGLVAISTVVGAQKLADALPRRGGRRLFR